MAAFELDEFVSRLERVYETLPASVERNMEVAAMDGIFLLERRLLEEGKDANETPFSPYTPQYAKKKKKDGKDVGYVNFKYSGDMLSSLGITQQQRTREDVRVTVAARDKFNQDKLDGNDTSRPGFMNLSTKEQQILAEDLAERVADEIETLLSQ